MEDINLMVNLIDRKKHPVRYAIKKILVRLINSL